MPQLNANPEQLSTPNLGTVAVDNHFSKLSFLKSQNPAPAAVEPLPEVDTPLSSPFNGSIEADGYDDGFGLHSIDSSEVLFTPPVQDPLPVVPFIKPMQELNITPPQLPAQETTISTPPVTIPSNLEAIKIPEQPTQVIEKQPIPEQVKMVSPIPAVQVQDVKPPAIEPAVESKPIEPTLKGILTSQKEIVSNASEFEKVAFGMRV
jgi:hypothetical protein